MQRDWAGSGVWVQEMSGCRGLPQDNDEDYDCPKLHRVQGM